MLKNTGWTVIPLDNVEHDFVSNLLKRYLKDLETRIKLHDSEEGGIAMSLRKVTPIEVTTELVNDEYSKVASLKDMADQKEKDLEKERILREHDRKVKKLIREKVEFKKVKGFKRQNSYLPEMEEFGDMDDAEVLKKNLMSIRRSFDPSKKREVFNTKI